MSVIVPPIYTAVHKEEVQNEASMVEEAARKMVQNSNWLLELRPIRSIVFIEVNQDGVPPIDLSVWQEADGGEITNPNSPIRTVGIDTRFTPNYQDKYPRVASGPAGSNDVPAATFAALTIQDLTYTANDSGVNGNNISIEYVAAGSLSITIIDSNTFKVNFVSGATTADQIKTAVDANTSMSNKVSTAVSGTGSNNQTSPVAAANLAGAVGFNQTHNVEHDHTGFTGGVSPTPPSTLEIGGDRRLHIDHVHAIAGDLVGGVFLDAPQFLKVIAYMRIV